MIKEEKGKIIDQLAENLSKSTIVIATEYRGITAKEMVQLRKQLRENGVDYKIAKNTLTKFAADKTGKNKLNDILSGPLALAIGYGDAVKPAKTLNDYIRSSGSSLKIIGGLLGNELLTAEDVVNLASIPSREVLLSKLVSQLFAPVQSLHMVLSSPLRGLIYVLNAREKQLG